MNRIALALLLIPFVAAPAHAQKGKNDPLSGHDRSARATVIHPAIVYVSGDDNAAHVAEVGPGHEVVIMERNGAWIRVFANTDQPDNQNPDKEPEFSDDADKPQPASGWIRDKGVINPSTPNGDFILYGIAANYEDQATRPHAPKNAPEAAHLLYRRVFEYFPNSPLAPEAAYRSADIRWQLDKADISTLPSAKEQEAYLRPQIYEGDMQKVIKQYPGSKFAALAAYDLLDNKLCGDWQGLPKCPEQESGLYEKYADRYPDSPKAAEALYNATYRQGVLVEMYLVDDNRKRSEAAAAAAANLAKELQQRFPQSDYSPRAAAVAYRVQQHISIYGSDRD